MLLAVEDVSDSLQLGNDERIRSSLDGLHGSWLSSGSKIHAGNIGRSQSSGFNAQKMEFKRSSVHLSRGLSGIVNARFDRVNEARHRIKFV